MFANPVWGSMLAELSARTFSLQHVYLDDQRIKGTQGGHLYGYELPQSCNASLDEEKLSISSTRSQTEKEREASTFTAIQRAINPISVHNMTG